MRNLLLKVIGARVTVPTYLITLSSLILAGYALIKITDLTPSAFAQGIYIGFVPWVILLFLGNLATVIGLILRHEGTLKVGALVSFAMWIFGGIAFLANQQGLTAVVVIVPYLIEYAYLYVCAALGVLHPENLEGTSLEFKASQ